MQNKRYISVLVVTMIAIAMLTGCGQAQQYPNFTPTPLPAQMDQPIRYNDKEEEKPMDPEFAAMRIPSRNDDGLWGFRDVMRNWVIEPKYTSIRTFSEGLAAVAIERDGNEYWGYVNETGREVIELKYNVARDFSNGLAFVREKNIVGKGTVSNNYIDTNGVTVLDFNTDITEGFEFDNEGMAVVYSLDGDVIYHGVIDRDGNFLIPFDKGFQNIAEMPGKFFAAIPAKPVDGNQNTGVIDQYGEWILAPKYDSVEVLGRERVLVGVEDEKGAKQQLVSFDSEVIVDLGYGYVDMGQYPFATKYDMFVFQKTGESMPIVELYDIGGNKLLADKSYELISILSEDVIFVADQDNGGQLANRAGDKVVDVDSLYGAMRISDEIIKVWDAANPVTGLYNFKQDIWVANPIYKTIIYYNGTQGEAIRDVQKADGNVTFKIDTFDSKGEVLTSCGETMTESEYDEMIMSIVDISSCYESW